MIPIQKGKGPEALDQLRLLALEQGLSENEAYAKLSNPLKGEVRQRLMCEQGHLCAYCMRQLPDRRILPEDKGFVGTYIEHWVPRSEQSGKALDYQNMLAVCSGGQKPAPGEKTNHRKGCLTCGDHREHTPLTVNPTIPSTLSTIFYHEDGRIDAKDENVRKDLQQTLNLNCESAGSALPMERKRALEAVQQDIIEMVNDPTEFQKRCREQLAFWDNETDPKTPFVGIILWWLRHQLQVS